MQKKVRQLPEAGTLIVGKWNHHHYTIIRTIGSGMIGTVYLCRAKGRLVALKMGTQPMALSREVTILKIFNKVRDQYLGPFLFDVDDWEVSSGRSYPFYVMEYINGVSLERFIKVHGGLWIGRIMVNMLENLEKLHQKGYVFGDFKNDNILITGRDPVVRFIDVGGVTKFGQSVKEYSNFYDRGFWLLGTRKAEPTYDLFALVMVLLGAFYPKQFTRTKNPKQCLYRHIQKIPSLRVYEPQLKKAIIGAYPTAKAMKSEIKQVMSLAKRKRKKKKNHLPEAILITLIAGIYYILSLII